MDEIAIAHEIRLRHAARDGAVDELRTMLAPDAVVVTADGYRGAEALLVLADDGTADRVPENARTLAVADDIRLVSYQQNDMYCVSVWEQTSEGWKLVCHQQSPAVREIQ